MFITCVDSSFLLLAEHFPIVWLSYSVFKRSSVEGYLGFFQFLSIFNKATGNIFVKVLDERRFSFFLGKYLGISRSVSFLGLL